MKTELILVLTQIFCSAIGDEGKSGFKVRLTRKGLDFLSDFARVSLLDFLSSYHSKVLTEVSGYYGVASYELKSLKLLYPGSAVTTDVDVDASTGATLTVDNLSFSLRSPYEVTVWPFYNTGTVQADVKQLRVIARFAADVVDGRLNVIVTYCHVDHAFLNILFEGGVINYILNYYSDRFKPEVQAFLRQKMCEFVEEYVHGDLRRTLYDLPLETTLFENFYLNYSLTEGPKFGNNSLETSHSGEVFGIDLIGNSSIVHQYPNNVSIIDLPTPYFMLEKMIYLYFSEYSLQSLMYFLYRYEKLNYKFLRETMPEDFREYLYTDCELLCAGFLFPELAKLHPNSSIDVYMNLTEPPKAEIVENMVNVLAPTTFYGYVRALNNANTSDAVKIFTGFVELRLALVNFTLENGTLQGLIQINKMVPTDFESEIPGITMSELQLILVYAIRSFVQPYLASFLENGIRIPTIGPFRLNASEVLLAENVLILSADYSV